jgi:hypothetical protein
MLSVRALFPIAIASGEKASSNTNWLAIFSPKYTVEKYREIINSAI